MSAKTKLMEAVARVPETVAQTILEQIEPYLRPVDSESSFHSPADNDHFQGYWSQWYGVLQDVEWEEPADLPFEPRDTW
jgi:hypothetical protein